LSKTLRLKSLSYFNGILLFFLVCLS